MILSPERDIRIITFSEEGKKPDVKVPTLLNERATIGHINKWGLEQGYITQDRLPIWSELKVTNIGTRTAFTIEDYQTLYGYLRNYTKNISDEREIYNRKLIRDFILVQTNIQMFILEFHHRFQKLEKIEHLLE